MDPGLLYVTYFSIIILIGILSKYLADKTKIPDILYLMSFGMILGIFSMGDGYLISFPDTFLSSIGILALAMIVFDSTSRLSIKSFDSLSGEVMKYIFFFTILLVTILSIFSYFLFGFESFYLALILSSLLIGSSPDAVEAMFNYLKGRKVQMDFLEIESIINSPLTLILPFIFIDFALRTPQLSTHTFLSSYLSPFFQEVVTGIGSGVVIGIIVFRGMRKNYSETISPLLILASASLTYVLAENLGGNGVLAVTTLGIFFGNIYVKHKKTLQVFSSFLSNLLKILIFVLLGIVTRIDQISAFDLFRSFVLFILFIVIRFFLTYILYQKKLNLEDVLFITFNAPKGIATAIAAFTLFSIYEQFDFLLPIVLLFVLISIVVSGISVYIFKNIEKKKSDGKKPISQDSRKFTKKSHKINKEGEPAGI
ncbi:MAG: cation:proton antiporter [Candidatus Woesearchaeota archaeon]